MLVGVNADIKNNRTLSTPLAREEADKTFPAKGPSAFASAILDRAFG